MKIEKILTDIEKWSNILAIEWAIQERSGGKERISKNVVEDVEKSINDDTYKQYICIAEIWALEHSSEQWRLLLGRIISKLYNFWQIEEEVFGILDCWFDDWISTSYAPEGASEEIYIFRDISRTIVLFLTDLYRITIAYKLDVTEICKCNGLEPSKLLQCLSYSHIETLGGELPSISTNEKYKAIPRTHRIAAAWALIDKLGLRKTVDKTKLACFIEAITGGNVEAKGKDTVSYKEPTTEAKAAAVELLKKNGIE